MSLAPGDLPLLLAGPVLRRVEVDLVCVWIATSQPCNASLLLFDGGDVAASDTPLGDQRAEWVSDVQATLPIGPHLHVLAITLDLRTPGGNAVRTNGALLPNRTYSYDLNFFTRDDPATRHTLLTEGLLDDPVPLGYDRGELPSFVTPPAEREQLVILHGSCRELFAVPPVEDDPARDDDPFEPPGGWPTEEVTPDNPAPAAEPDPFPSDAYPAFPKRDGMLWVDALIDQRASLPQFRFAGRPHQLFLTGDQIYADSMSAVVLPVLNHVGRVLMGDEDLGSNPVDATAVPATLENFPPGFRRGAAVRSAAFTMSGGSSHVFSFGEFIAHYLLAWSPALWEKEDLSKDGFNKDLWPDDFIPAAIPMPEDFFLQWTFTDEVERTHTADYETLRSTLSELKKELPERTDIPGPDAPEREQVEWFFRQRRDWIASKYWSPDHFEWWTRRFRAGLPRVRRALANVPTYMIGDDHEITDDWYFSRQWRERVFTRTLGVDIIRNGLTAYTVMQAWGNDPRRWSQGSEANLLQAIGAFMALTPAERRTSSDRVHELLGLPRPAPPPGSPPQPTPTFRPLVEFSYQVEGPCHRVLVVDGRTKRRFPHRLSQAGGIDYEGGNALLPDDVHPTGLPGEQSFGLFGDSPMAAALPPRPIADTKITLVVLAVPALGPEGMELALVPLQRLARLLTQVDAESWAYDAGTFEALLASLARYESVVLLSGDIHAGFTAYADYWSAPAGEPVRTARLVQLVSSGLTKDWGEYGPAFIGHTLSHEIFESATTPTQPHAERVGWGTPLKQVPVEPPTIGDIVTVPDGSVAHPTYRARLRMRAPVVPTHGWPAGTTEARDPNWAWRAFMVRDEREEFPTTPTAVSRFTPLELPPDPRAASVLGWHASAARRMAYGRVFCFLPNVGVVTFEKDLQDQWAVRHVLAGELPPMPDTGFTPELLQPFIVHKVALAPPAATTWLSERPRIVGDGGWGGDDSDPAFQLLLHALPRLWERAAGFIGADGIFAGSPVVVDDIVREAVLTDAADRIGPLFRRKVLRELGPFAISPDDVLDAVPQADVDARLGELGKLDLAREARAMVRPDLERLLLYHQSLPDPAARLDDILFTACSDWVNEYSGLVSTVAGLLATFRAPVTKHVPVLSHMMGGLWSLWRDRTGAERWSQAPARAVLLGVPERVARFAALLLSELAIGVIEDHDPRPIGNAPVIFSPELLLSGLGIALGAVVNNRRLNFVSGWEDRARVPVPGTRNTVTNAQVLARQTMSLLIHSGGQQRYVLPARKLSFTMVPAANTVEPGRLFVGWDGGLLLEEEIGDGLRARIETTGRGFLEQPWGLTAPRGAPGTRLSLTLLYPTSIAPLPGLTVRLTPSVGVSLGFVGVPTAENTSFQLRLALNDKEDRIKFVPGDGLLSQLLPTDGISLPLDAAITWSPYGGWKFVGIGELARGVALPPATGQAPATPSEAATEVVTTLNQKLGPITLHERRLEVTTTAIPMLLTDEDIGLRVTVTVSGTLSLNIKAARLTFTGIGLVWRIPIGEDAEAIDNPIDVKLPNGVAVALNAPSISGGGFLQRIEAPDGRVTWRGGLALRFADSFELAAFGVIELGGNRPWTFLLFVTVRFTPPYPLAFGLKLTTVGGLLALNRTMAVDALRDAVLGTPGALDTALFAQRPEEQLPVVLPTIDRFFPAAQGHQVAGLLVEIEWRAETGTLFGHFRGVLLAEFENIQFALYGTAQLGFPTLTQDHILRVRAGLEAVYDYRNKFVRVSLALTEALLFSRVRLTGGAALLFRWGDHDEFAFTLGGFHPSFRPYIPAGLREPARLGATWHPNEFVDLNLQGYFAVTWASLQFGFSAHVEIGASWGGLRADADFNFLVMRKPRTLFELDLQFRVTAHMFGCDLFSAGLKGSMTGPDPWVIEGTIYWEVCGVDMSKDFGPYQWGDDLGQIEQAQEQARRVIGDAVADPASWSVRRQTAPAVRLRPGANDALDPRDQIDVRQAQLPLGIALEVYDANGLSDAGAWSLVGTGGVAKLSDLTDVFPTRRYLRKPPKDQPFRGGLASGARFGSTAWSVPVGAVASDESLTEDRVLDSLMVPPPQPATGHPLNVGVHFAEAILIAAPSRAVERKWTRHVVALEATA